jgi:hypothetical protein
MFLKFKKSAHEPSEPDGLEMQRRAWLEQERHRQQMQGIWAASRFVRALSE